MAISKEQFETYGKRVKSGVRLHKGVEVFGSIALSELDKGCSKIKAHASSESHMRQVDADLLASREKQLTHLKRFGDSERSKKRKALKALLRCTH